MVKLPILACIATAIAAAVAIQADAAVAAADAPHDRAVKIVAQMTLDEKISQLHGIRTSTDFRTVPGIPRLGIPALLLTNGPAGVSSGGVVQPRATALPAPISLAASWDLRQAKTYGTVEAQEVKDVGRNVLEAPTVNIARVPVNGRTFEGYGEDPYLAARFSVGDIEAVQANGVMANVKHFLANNQETNRTTVNEVIDERTLREIYMPAFEASVTEAHTATVMCAYPKVNGAYNCENGLLLNDVLRKEWGFDGFVFSDFGAVHSTAPSINAGLDLETPTGTWFNATTIKAALANGSVTMARIDDMLIRRYTTMIEFGLFDHPPTTTPIPARTDGATARHLAEEGMVLLKNAPVDGKPVLPLRKSQLTSIALIGKDVAVTGGGGSSQVDPIYTVKPSDGLRNRTGTGVSVVTNDGTDIASAAALAKTATVAIVMVQDAETEGHDRPNLSLSGNQDALVSAVAAANPKTIVVSKTGGPILMPWLSKVPAVLQAWYPGEEDGNAVADVLFGAFNPSGKLPITFPAHESDVPASSPGQYPGVDGTAIYSEGVFVGYRHYDQHKIAPLFPFGYGLSYTTYQFSNLKITKGTGAAVTVEVDVTNTGPTTGAEIAELYVGSPSTASVPEPPQQLQGFRKVLLQPGQTGHVSFTLNARSFSYWSTGAHAWKVAGGTYHLFVGDSSRDEPVTGTVKLAAS